MKQFVVTFVVFAFALFVANPNAYSQDTIAFSGRIVSSHATQPLATVTPETTTNTNGQSQTVYVVKSTVTGSRLATFTTASAAQTYASTVTPAAAYRSP